MFLLFGDEHNNDIFPQCTGYIMQFKLYALTFSLCLLLYNRNCLRKYSTLQKYKRNRTKANKLTMRLNASRIKPFAHNRNKTPIAYKISLHRYMLYRHLHLNSRMVDCRIKRNMYFCDSYQ